MMYNFLLFGCVFAVLYVFYIVVTELFKMDAQLDYNTRETYETREL